MKIQILKQSVLKEVPSASGLEIYNNKYYLVGDNSPFLFVLNEQMELAQKIVINSAQSEVIEKKQKPDFEAMTMIETKIQDEILIFGSGSKAIQRDGLVRVILGDTIQVQHFSLSKLYAKIKKVGSIDSDSLNIEAATADRKNLYLFNRGKNRIIVFKLKEFLSYINGVKHIPEPKIYKIRLPKLHKIKAGLSGASIIANQKKIILTASVENTTNTYDDGEILGSFVGVIPIKKLSKKKYVKFVLITENKKPIKIKVESVAVTGTDDNGNIYLKMVTDSDGKESEFIEAVLNTKL